MMLQDTKFRAIIVGGGPAGLGMAHALTLAGIDYVLLERGNSVVVESGASLAMWPHSVRVLDQFGLLEEARGLYMPIRHKHNLRPDGTEIARNNMFEAVETNHGHPWMLFHRRDLLDLLYCRLPNAEKHILTNKDVVKITDPGEGEVTVFCQDGTEVTGSIIIGCDGVHSTVRRLMREMALSSDEKPTDDERPMKTCYQGLIGHVNLLEGLEPGAVWEVRNRGRSLQLLTGTDTAYFFMYNRLPKPTYERANYTDEDAERLASTVLNHPMTAHLKFGDIWKARRWVRMVNFEEGFVKKWHRGRVVLVGDAVHKMTPNAGFSLNTGWQGVVELTNRLRALLLLHHQHQLPGASPEPPDTASLEAVFRAYQRSREKIARETAQFSGLYTRIVAWQNIGCKLADWLTPYMGGDKMLLGLLASPLVKRGITLDFVEETAHKTGKVEWVNKRQQQQQHPEKTKEKESRKENRNPAAAWYARWVRGDRTRPSTSKSE